VSLRRWLRGRRRADPAAQSPFRDVSPEVRETADRALPYTMTTWERLCGLVEATEYVVQHGVPGAIVECGVWKGGSMLAAALTLVRLGATDRELYLFDTYEGLPEPGERDVSFKGKPAHDTWKEQVDGEGLSAWCRAGLDEVRAVMETSGHPPERIHYVAGLVEDTVPEAAPAEIAILRLDTDWYASTRHELVHLYPRLAVGGVLILDDYGSWQGAREAVDEYLAERSVPLLLQRLDKAGRIAVKVR
jgi:hypothetical protein